jgi:mannitol-1-/sugar-/sorbitol-6-phosphatase
MFSVDGLLFDLDGTLVDSDSVVERCWRRWAAGVGVDPDRLLPLVHGRQSHEVMAEFLPERPRELNLADHERMLAWEVEDTEGVVPIPGAPELLAALDGARWGIVTSCTRPVARARLAAGGLPTPAVLVTAEQVTSGKPHPDGFLQGAAALGVDASRCLAFEDAPAGIAAAGAAGMRVIAVGQRGDVGPVAFRVPTLRDVRVTPAGRELVVEVTTARPPSRAGAPGLPPPS